VAGMTYAPETDPLAVDFDFDTQYTVITDPNAVDFDLAAERVGPGGRGITGSATVTVTSTASISYTNIGVAQSVVGAAAVAVESNSDIAKNKVRITGATNVALESNSTLLFTNIPIARSVVGEAGIFVTPNAVTGVNRTINGASTVTVVPDSEAAKNKVRFVGSSNITATSNAEIAIGRNVIGVNTINVTSNSATAIGKNFVGSSTVTVASNSPTARNKVRIVGDSNITATSAATTTFTDNPANQDVIGNSAIFIESFAVFGSGRGYIGSSSVSLESNSDTAKNKVRLVGNATVDVINNSVPSYTNVPINRQITGSATATLAANADLVYARNREFVGESSVTIESNSATAKNKRRVVGNSIVLLTARGATAVNRKIFGFTTVAVESNATTSVSRSIVGSSAIAVETSSELAKNRDRIIGSANIDVTANAVTNFTNVSNTRSILGASALSIENNSEAAKNKDRITGAATIDVTSNAVTQFVNVANLRSIFGISVVNLVSNAGTAIGKGIVGNSNVALASNSQPARNKDRILGASNVVVTSNAVTNFTGIRSFSGFNRITVTSTSTLNYFEDPEGNVTTGETRLVPSSRDVLSGVDFGFTVNVETIEDGTIDSLRVRLRDGDAGEEIEINTGASSFSLSGAYLGAFADKFTFTDAGESDRTQTPQTVTYLRNLPPGKNLFKLEQDQRQSVNIRYDVTVTYTITIPGEQPTLGNPTGTPSITRNGVENLTFTHTVIQNLDAVRRVLQDYKYNGTGALA